jgi:hypothetical protein
MFEKILGEEKKPILINLFSKYKLEFEEVLDGKKLLRSSVNLRSTSHRK